MPAEALVPEGQKCAFHPDVDAMWTCNRCGNLMCQGCERRVRPDSSPMCPNCWNLRAQTVQHQETNPKAWVTTLAVLLGVGLTVLVIILRLAVG